VDYVLRGRLVAYLRSSRAISQSTIEGVRLDVRTGHERPQADIFRTSSPRL
jgi:hypothetical protein